MEWIDDEENDVPSDFEGDDVSKQEINPKLKELIKKLQDFGRYYAILDRHPNMINEKVEWARTMHQLGLEIYQLGVFVGTGGK